MILDTLDHAASLACLSPAFADAAAFLAGGGLADLAPGRFDVGTNGVSVIVAYGGARRADEGRLEAHRRFADIQLLLAGRESIGWRPLADCRQPDAAYDPATDLQFFADPPQAWLPLEPGQFAVFWPADAHLPQVGEGDMKKLVVKVPLAEG
jgi:YhcH/YjgK/YiaL family protein